MATPQQQRRHKVHLVRYADDFIITGTSRFLLEHRVQPLVAHFLSERGLELSHEKTKITHLEQIHARSMVGGMGCVWREAFGEA